MKRDAVLQLLNLRLQQFIRHGDFTNFGKERRLLGIIPEFFRPGLQRGLRTRQKLVSPFGELMQRRTASPRYGVQRLTAKQLDDKLHSTFRRPTANNRWGFLHTTR